MTESQLRSNVANWLVKYAGIKEGSAQHLEILKVFNDSKLCTRYTMKAKDAWCATSVSASFIANKLAGNPGSGKLFECVECSCGNMIKMAQTQGIWVENDAYVPKIGDVVLYDWDDTTGSSKDNTGWPEHVGIVIGVSGNTFKVIEGNMNDTVGYRNMTVNGKYIRGFITPNYAKFATPEPVVESKPATTTTATTNKTPNKTCKFEGRVTATSLNVRSWAGTENKTLRSLPKGTVVEVCDTVLDKDGDAWYYIKQNGKYGFVFSEYIEKVVVTVKPAVKVETPKTTTPNKTCKFKGKVTASSLKVRSWAGTEHSHLRSLKKGTTVEVCDTIKASTGKNWYYIKQGGKYGFVCADYIARV